MRSEQTRWTPTHGWTPAIGTADADKAAQLVLVFGESDLLQEGAWFEPLRARFPVAAIVSCSTADEIHGTEIGGGGLGATGIHFEHSQVRTALEPISGPADSFAAGCRVARQLLAPDLRHVLVFAEGIAINGTAFTSGLRATLPDSAAVTGGLAGDGARMAHTSVGVDGPPRAHQVAAVGLYGDRLDVRYGSLGGWDPFGPERVVTRAVDNVLYELDGEPALSLYQRYLGDYAADLPASGLRFPLALHGDGSDRILVRTILGIDEAHGSITFAGAIPVGTRARLMRANFDRLVEGAVGAARGCLDPDGPPADLALLISCIGRRLVLGQRTEEEIEGVREVLGDTPVLAGFYSNGEICPQIGEVRCELHNQTMTITTLAER